MILNGGELDGHRIVSADGVREMTPIHTGDIVTGFTPGNGWGLGWCVVREPQGVSGMLSPGTFGHGGAFGTEAWVDPVKQRIFVLIIHAPTSATPTPPTSAKTSNKPPPTRWIRIKRRLFGRLQCSFLPAIAR